MSKDLSDSQSGEYQDEMRIQHDAPHMRGPWVVEEMRDGNRMRSIRVVHYFDGGNIEIAYWSLSGVTRGSAAYFLARAHAEVLAGVPDSQSASPKSMES